MELEDSKYFRDLDWGRLKGFYYVAKEGNLNTAAQFLKLTQSAMSRQISSFEKQLGYPLFMRMSTGVKLTRRGKDLFEVVERMFFDIKEVAYKNYIAGNRDQKRKERKIRISTTHAIAAYIIYDILSDYQENHPYLIFELITHDKLIDIIVNDVDIAIRPYDNEAQGIEQDYLFSLRKKLYASKKYLEKYGEPKTVEELKSHRLIAPANPQEYPYSDVEWILKLGMPKGKLNKSTFTSTALECLVNEAKRGKGIIGGYEQMSIIRDTNLTRILLDVVGEEIKEYFTYPCYLREDKEIINLKEYLKNELSKEI